MKSETIEKINKGISYCKENNFFETLALLLKYYFLSSRSNVNLLDLMREVSKSEMEFKTFMVYKNFAIDIFYNEIKDRIDDEITSYDDIIYLIIYFVKTKYDTNHSILSSYISGIDNDEVLEAFQYIKSTYKIQKEELTKVNKLYEAITLMEMAKKYEEDVIKLQKDSKECRDKALSILYEVHSISKKNLQLDNGSFTHKK